VRTETRFEAETSLGPVVFWGRDTGKPVLLLINGSFADFQAMWRMGAYIEGVDYWRAHLPGNHAPRLIGDSIGVYAAAFDEAIGVLAGDRPVVAAGLSVGALVALALRAPNVRRVVAVEPILQTEGIWFLPMLHEQAPPGFDDYLRNVLGLGPDTVEPRDYTPMLRQLAVPAVALVGDYLPGQPHQFPIMPSMVTEAARRALAAHPTIEVVVAPGAGHNVPRQAPGIVLDRVVGSCRAAFGASVRRRSSEAAALEAD
jgi:pimeloyl-ACP methyl ester carboxylesterase